MLWLSSYIQNWQMTKIDHLPTKHKLLHFTSSTPTIDVEPKKGGMLPAHIQSIVFRGPALSLKQDRGRAVAHA